MLKGLNLIGISTIERDDGYDVVGGTIRKATIDSHGDHRIAMSFMIAGLIDGMNVEDIECIDTSFPNFYDIFKEISEVTIWR